MNRLTKLISGTVAIAAVMGTALVAGHSLASVPCIPYTDTNLQTSQTPLFNDICGVPSLLSSTDGTYPLGDEPDFVRIRPNISGNDTVSKDNPKLTSDLTSACADGSKFDVWTYVHNDASPDFNNNGAGSAVAHNVKVALAAAGVNTTKSNFSFGSTVSANNAESVSDTATLNCGGKTVTMTLVPSSVHYNNNLNQTVYNNLPDSSVNSSIGIGSPVFPTNGLGGDVWGCWDFRTVIVYQVVVKDVPAPVVTATCDLFTVLANADRKVTVNQFKFTAVNAAFNNAVIDWGDGSAPTTSASPVGQTHQYAADGTFLIKATAHFTVNGQDVAATSPACQQQVKFVPAPVTPIFTCDTFQIQANADRVVKVNAFAATAQNGAVFKNVVIDWNDGTPALTSTNPVGQTHQFAKDGTFNITAVAHFTVNGQDVTATGPQCEQKVQFVPAPVVPVFTCDKFEISADANRMVKATAFSVTANNGATFKKALIDWGDNTPVTTVNSVAGVIGQTHQYAADNTYTITATAVFTVNGQEMMVAGPQCQQIVTFQHNQPPVVPVFTCDKFDLSADASRNVKVTAFHTTAQNATFAMAVIDWGDGTTPLTTNDVLGQTHKFAKDGSFVVTATVHFTVDGKDLVAGTVKCQQQVHFAANVPPTVTPPTVTTPGSTLINTGPGANLAAMFAAATAIGMIVYRRLLARGLRG